MNVLHDPSFIRLGFTEICAGMRTMCLVLQIKKDPVTNRGFQIIHGCLYNNATKSTRMYGHLANLR